MGVEFKNGVIKDGGRVIGNVKNDVIREGSSSSPGSGRVIGNVKNDVIREGSSSSPGSGRVIGNVKGGVVRRGSSSSAGSGSTVGKTRDYSIKGANYVDEAIAVACYHFLIRRIF